MVLELQPFSVIITREVAFPHFSITAQTQSTEYLDVRFKS